MESGKGRRYRRLMGSQNRTVIVATDDGLIGGPTGLLARMGEILKETREVDGVLMYRGHLLRNWEEMGQRAAVLNLTASVKGNLHTEKIMCGTVTGAVKSGADWVAAHVNVGSKYENKMIENLAKIVEDADKLGIPVLGIMYPRGEGSDGDDNFDKERRLDNSRYVKRVAHAARIGAELGVDLIKTQYTGTGRRVPESCRSHRWRRSSHCGRTPEGPGQSGDRGQGSNDERWSRSQFREEPVRTNMSSGRGVTVAVNCGRYGTLKDVG